MERTTFIGLSVVMVLVVLPHGYQAIDAIECPVKIGLLYQAEEYSWIRNLRSTAPVFFLEEIGNFCTGTFPEDVIDIKIPNRSSDALFMSSVVEKLISRHILIGPFYPDIAAFSVKNKIVYFLTRILDIAYAFDKDIAYANNEWKTFNDYVIEMWPSQSTVIDGVAGYMVFYGIKKVAVLMMDAKKNTIDIAQALYQKLVTKSLEVEVYQHPGSESDALNKELLHKRIKTVVLISEEFSTNMTSSLLKIKKLFFDPKLKPNLDRDGYEFMIYEMVLQSKMKAPFASVGNVGAKLISIYSFKSYDEPQGIDATAFADIRELLKELFARFGALPKVLQTSDMFASNRKNISNLRSRICINGGPGYGHHGERLGCFIAFEAWSLGRPVNYRGAWIDGIFHNSLVSMPPLPYIVHAIVSKPFFTLKQGADGVFTKNKRYEGIAVDIMNVVVRSVRRMEGFEDFKIKYVVREDGLYGSQDANGSWSGLFGQLDADTAGNGWREPKTLMAVGSILKTSDRLKSFTFLPGVIMTPLSFVIGRHGEGQLVGFQFLMPYDTEVWVGVVVAVVLAAGFVYGLDRWNLMVNDLEPSARYNLNESLWYSYQTITQVGGEIVCSILPMRLFSVFYWFFSLVVIACYTSNLANFLTEPAFDRSGLSFADLAQESDIKIGFLADTAAWKFFRDMAEAEKERKFSRAVVFRNMTEAIERVRTENIALIEERIGLLMEAVTDPSCDLAVSDAVIGSFDVSFPLSKTMARSIDDNDVRLREEIVNTILDLRHSGKLHEITKRWLKDDNCVLDIETLNRRMQFGIWNFMGLFAITGGATVLAFVVLMAKVLYNAPGRTKKQDRGQEIEETKEVVSGCAEVYSVLSTRL
ncbi:glutamate receptor 4-like [Lineus longissimus]|uniref:glutamate receptor 4-like n=1 Tax=Lineus longissimus TaxID=88925 RepID=UPI00315D2899